jgi:hypothetical protein
VQLLSGIASHFHKFFAELNSTPSELPAHVPLRVSDKLGPYEILAPIGKGGMGEVYCHHERLRRDVTIKVTTIGFYRALHASPRSAWFHASSGYYAAGSPPLDQGANASIIIVTNWEATLEH